jgi:uncharacterized protein
MTTFIFNAHELPRRAGEMREYEITIDQHPPVGVALLAIPADAPIYVDLRLQAVAEGVLVSGEVRAEAVGECTRCLEPVSFDVDESFTELYNYEIDPRQKGGSKSGKKAAPVEVEVGDEDEQLWMEGDLINLEAPIRDAVILNMPIHPLCSEDCLGLCPGCGQKWADLPDEHEHAVSDIRWAGLENWSSPTA